MIVYYLEREILAIMPHSQIILFSFRQLSRPNEKGAGVQRGDGAAATDGEESFLNDATYNNGA